MWSDLSFTVPPCPLNTANKYSRPKTKALLPCNMSCCHTPMALCHHQHTVEEKIWCNNSHMACFVWGDKICSTDRMPRQVYGVSEIPFHLSLLLFLLYHLDFTVLPLGVTVADRAGVLKSSHACQRSQIVTDSAVSYYSVISECVCVRTSWVSVSRDFPLLILWLVEPCLRDLCQKEQVNTLA